MAVDLALHRGGGACGGTRVKGNNLANAIQKTKYSALLTARMRRWLGKDWTDPSLVFSSQG
eukprot:8260883-Pyramimonas_sp.AAC.1